MSAQDGFVSMLVTPEKIAMVIADQSPPHFFAPKLLSCPVSGLETPDSYRKACEDERTEMCGSTL